ncbi:MAG: amidohydrolase [bacterium]|jgi:amidohydrolase
MAQLKDEILSLAEKLYPLQVKWRRHLHQFPELSDKEFETTRFIRKELTPRGIKFLPLRLKTGAAGIINGRQSLAVGVRADIDALPILEKTRLPFRSRHQGVMHACGHDAHTAILMGTSIILQRLRSKIPGAVKLIFQPAEEMPPGGADAMIKAGILKNPDVKIIFALHVDPTLPTGEIGLRDGPTMASVTDFDITVYGLGGHAARPHLGVDAVAVAAELVSSMQKIVSRETDPLEPVVITFGTINGGTARNVIADKVVLRATARTLSSSSLRRLPGLIRRSVDGICRARGAKYEIDFIAGYPVLSNDPAVNRIYQECYRELFGNRKIALVPQVMGGEDFAYYLQMTAGAMFRLGVRNNKLGANKPWHASDFMIDERGIFYGTALMARAVFKFFESR